MAFFRRKSDQDDAGMTYGDYGREVVEAYNGIRALRHDLRSHLDVMDALAGAQRWNELAAYIRQLRGEFLALAAVTLSGNAAVDALLSARMKAASAAGVDMQVHAVLPYRTALTATDWTALLGNLTANALEACTEVKQAGGAPFIRLDISFSQGMLCIEVENSSAGRYIRRGSSFASTKGKGRGLGLQRVADIVKAHGGYIAHTAGPDAFLTRAILPLEE